MRILILEPYYGGSHKQFLDSLIQHVEADYHLMTLPARKWKMRMQLSASWFVQCIEKLEKNDRFFDLVLCSTFLDLAVFKALTSRVDGWNSSAKLFVYFHENQFEYPNQQEAPENFQFTAINFNSGLVADSLAFNSDFNRRSFFKGSKKYLNSATDMKLHHCFKDIENKSRVLYPGLSFEQLDKTVRPKSNNNTLTIVWNHRWEHDKNPEEFFTALYKLKKRKVRFQLIVLGESFTNSPSCFSKAYKDFEEHIVHFGFAKSREEYFRFLKASDIVVSTSIHEFFGIAVIEAVRAGCFPLLPKRLSYPELFDRKEYFYKDGKLDKSLENLIRNYRRLEEEEVERLTEKYSWQRISGEYKSWLLSHNQLL